MNNNLKYKCAPVYKSYLYCHDSGVTWLMLHDSYIMTIVRGCSIIAYFIWTSN